MPAIRVAPFATRSQTHNEHSCVWPPILKILPFVFCFVSSAEDPPSRDAQADDDDIYVAREVGTYRLSGGLLCLFPLEVVFQISLHFFSTPKNKISAHVSVPRVSSLLSAPCPTATVVECIRSTVHSVLRVRVGSSCPYNQNSPFNNICNCPHIEQFLEACSMRLHRTHTMYGAISTTKPSKVYSKRSEGERGSVGWQLCSRLPVSKQTFSFRKLFSFVSCSFEQSLSATESLYYAAHSY